MLWIIVCSVMAAPIPIEDGLKLIAHRGGVVDALRPENTRASLDAAILDGYWMIELDLRRTRDGVVFLQHDGDFRRTYGSGKKTSETKWKDAAKLTSLNGGQHPITFKEAAEACRGKARVMIDIHEDWPDIALSETGAILRENDLLDSAIIIGNARSKDFFKGKARLATSLEGLRKAAAAGEDVAALYCLFMHGNELDGADVRYAAALRVPVVASVNAFHYLLKPAAAGAESDIRRLYDAGVRLFQIDSLYAPIFRAYRPSPFPELDTAQHWLWENPADGTNASARRERMAILQAAADECPHDVASRFLLNAAGATGLAERYGILHALARASDRAYDEIVRTRVESGLAGWLLYNMGFVFKTPEACFGVDVCLRDAARFADIFDFLLVTHPHPDHSTKTLVHEMIARGKPVVSSFVEGGIIVKTPWEGRFGAIRVKVDIGDHTPRSPVGRDNMCMYRIDCGSSANDAVIYHSGDGANYEKMTPGRPVDIFIPHVACSGMNVADAVRHLNPKFALIAHILELTHAKGGARWSYDYSFNAIKDLPEAQARILVWGERFVLPGSQIAMPN